LDAKIKKGNDEVIYDFNHTMIKTMKRISKQVAIEVKNHLDEKKEKEPNFIF
jgi:hypothetical protein